MSIVLKQEIARLKEVLKENPDDAATRQELLKVEKDLAELKPSAPAGNVCTSCEG